MENELTNFENRRQVENQYSKNRMKYPNIELSRQFDAKSFRENNTQITRMASTRAGTMRSHVKTSEPRKRIASHSQPGARSTLRRVKQGGAEIEESESQY